MMRIDYKKFWEMLIDRDIKCKYRDALKICKALKCDISEMMEKERIEE